MSRTCNAKFDPRGRTIESKSRRPSCSPAEASVTGLKSARIDYSDVLGKRNLYAEHRAAGPIVLPPQSGKRFSHEGFLGFRYEPPEEDRPTLRLTDFVRAAMPSGTSPVTSLRQMCTSSLDLNSANRFGLLLLPEVCAFIAMPKAETRSIASIRVWSPRLMQ